MPHPGLTLAQSLEQVTHPVMIIGVDPGPVSSAYVAVRVRPDKAVVWCAYLPNKHCGSSIVPVFLRDMPPAPGEIRWLSYERCGAQHCYVGSSVFETSEMAGAIREAFHGHVAGVYAMRPSEWRYALCGRGNARAPEIYAQCCELFPLPTNKAADPYRGLKNDRGPFAPLYDAGAGGNVEHLKDALGAALALTRVGFRTGGDPEMYRLAL